MRGGGRVALVTRGLAVTDDDDGGGGGGGDGDNAGDDVLNFPNKCLSFYYFSDCSTSPRFTGTATQLPRSFSASQLSGSWPYPLSPYKSFGVP